MLVSSCGHYDSWLSSVTSASHSHSHALSLCSLVGHLLELIKHGNNMTKRSALHAMHAFVPTLVKSRHAPLALDIVTQLLHLRHSTYNLVKCELVDLLASLDYRALAHAEQAALSSSSSSSSSTSFSSDCVGESSSSTAAASASTRVKCSLRSASRTIQSKIVQQVFVHLLGSEDTRVRQETVRALARFALNACFDAGTGGGGASASSLRLTSTTSGERAMLMAAEQLLVVDGFGVHTLDAHGSDIERLSSAIINSRPSAASAPGAGSTSSESGSVLSNSWSPSLASSSLSSGFGAGSSMNNMSNAVSSMSTNTATSLVHGSRKQRHMRYANSPLGSVSLHSALPWLVYKANNVLNNTFVQPLYSLVKYCPATNTAGHANTVRTKKQHRQQQHKKNHFKMNIQ